MEERKGLASKERVKKIEGKMCWRKKPGAVSIFESRRAARKALRGD